MATNWKKLYEEEKEKNIVSKSQIEYLQEERKKDQKIIDDYGKSERITDNHTLIVSVERYKEEAKRWKNLYKSMEIRYNDLLNTKWSNSENMEKARLVKIENREKRIEKYQKKIIKILEKDSKINTKQLIEELNINNKTFYNLELNIFLKSVK